MSYQCGNPHCFGQLKHSFGQYSVHPFYLDQMSWARNAGKVNHLRFTKTRWSIFMAEPHEFTCWFQSPCSPSTADRGAINCNIEHVHLPENLEPQILIQRSCSVGMLQSQFWGIDILADGINTHELNHLCGRSKVPYVFMMLLASPIPGYS